MSNYLKKFMFTLLVFMMPYMSSVSKAMETDDYEGSAVRASKTSFATEDQQDAKSFTTHPTTSQIVSLEDSQESWASYLLSPAKRVVQNTYDVLNFATKSPNHALFVGSILAYQVASIAARCYNCECIYKSPYNDFKLKLFAGGSNTNDDCYNSCEKNLRLVFNMQLCDFVGSNCYDKCGDPLKISYCNQTIPL